MSTVTHSGPATGSTFKGARRSSTNVVLGLDSSHLDEDPPRAGATTGLAPSLGRTLSSPVPARNRSPMSVLDPLLNVRPDL